MSIALIVTSGYGNGSLSGSIADIITEGYTILPVVSLPSFYWVTQNTVIGSTWDAGATLWDLDGNVIQTYWDETDPTYSNVSTNTDLYTVQGLNCAVWDVNTWNLQGNVYQACWNETKPTYTTA